jgi:hypothetical protein
MDHHDAVDQLLECLADRLAQRIVDKLRSDDLGLLDQSSSPLGRRRHIAFVRAGGGVQIGRRYLAKREDVLAQLEKLARVKPRPGKVDTEQQAVDRLAAELGLRWVKR